MTNQPAAKERTVVVEDENLRQFAGGFTSIPNRILRNNTISLGARMCYGMLLSYAWQDDFCFPAQTQLAKDLGITDRSVRTFLNELRDHGLVDWKQRGLNRPNIYSILKLPALVSSKGHNGNPGPENISGPDRKQVSSQDRKQASDYKDSKKNTQVVNDVTGNDHQPLSQRRTPIVGTQKRQPPTISDRALRSNYQLTDEQIGRVHWLVEKQTEVLAAADRNHAHYVKRAAEAVRDGHHGLLDRMLGELKQAATELAVGSLPAYFHAMWTEALNAHLRPGDPPPLLPPTTTPRGAGRTLPVGELFRTPDRPSLDDSRARMIADAERRGVSVPGYIRSADLAAVSRWWASVVESPDLTRTLAPVVAPLAPEPSHTAPPAGARPPGLAPSENTTA